jgi:hypothetical protein
MKTTKERSREYRKRQLEAGKIKLTIYTKPENREPIKAFAKKLEEKK